MTKFAPMNLGDMHRGEKAVIVSVQNSDLGLKLMEMGFLVGEEITFLRRAPMGDPIEVKVGNYLLSLRKDEAVAVTVEKK